MKDLAGKRVLITGASSGIGLQTAVGLARRGAELVLPVRDRRRGEQARSAVAAVSPGIRVHMMDLDLASLASVRRCAQQFAQRFPGLDVRSGRYFVKETSTEPDSAALDDEAAGRLWQVSGRLTGVKFT